MSYKYFPELDYYFNQYWVNHGIITTDAIDLPDVIISPNSKSVFNLLFNDDFDQSSYDHTFIVNTESILPKLIKERINYIKEDVAIFSSVPYTVGNLNIFDFTNIDTDMFDLILEYRTTGSTDITSIAIIDMDTPLSQMMFLYLDLKLNNNMDAFNTTTIISNDTYIETLYELYIINECFSMAQADTVEVQYA